MIVQIRVDFGGTEDGEEWSSIRNSDNISIVSSNSLPARFLANLEREINRSIQI